MASENTEDFEDGYKPTRFWEAAPKTGRKPIYTDPNDLWADCIEYFEWVEANPLQAAESVKFQGQGRLMAVPKMRAMSISGLCVFLGIATKTWHNYANNEAFLHVTSRVSEIMRSQKFEGAAAEMLNPNIIARDLGLADKKELTGAGGGPIETVNKGQTPAEAAAAYEATLKGEG